tara:strand:- start:19271 stop:19630 length:360 start_codon:yes stop_codon:yes gene_type:complete
LVKLSWKGKIVCVDLDGTICEEVKKKSKKFEYAKRKIIPEAIEVLRWIRYKKFKIFIFTSRYKTDLKVTKNWLKKYKVPYDKLILKKLKYDYLIDDKCIGCLRGGIDWKKIKQTLKEKR